jgi:hypothetical protein
MKPHRGRLLAIAVEATGLNKEDVAIKAGYSRSAYYKHVENPNLDYHILMSYGKAIRHDFTAELPDMPRYMMQELDEVRDDLLTREEAIRQRDGWKDKYLELLEKYNKVIEELMSRKEKN